MAGRIAGYRNSLQRLQSAYELRSIVAAAPAVLCTGEAYSRSCAVASTSAPGSDQDPAQKWSSSMPRYAASHSFHSSAAFSADTAAPTSATLQAKKEYRQKSEQKPGRRKKPPPSRSIPAAPAPQPVSYQAPQETIEEVEEGYVIIPWDSLIDCGTGTRELMTTEKSITELAEADICQYFPLQPQSLPEAFPEHNKSPASGMLPKSGCKGLQDEYEATGQQYIMYRPFLHALRQAVQERQLRQLLLDGMPGAGKSIAVATLAHWARQAGWVVLYVANAEVLTDGGFFSYNEAAGGWDTPQSAQLILHNLLASHKEALGAMRTKDGARSLAEVASEGVDSSSHAVAVDAALAVLEGLEAQSEVPVLIAVDRYNALYIDSEYGQTISDKARRLIPAAELRLAKAMRVLEREPMANGLHLAAPARHDRISQRVPMTLTEGCPVVELPRFVPEEWKNILDWYDATDVLHQDSMDAMQSFMLCQGNARELRQVGEGLTMQYSTVQYHDRR